MYKTSSKSDNFSLRYGDLTIFKMAAVRHLKFYTFAFFVPSPCQHAVLLSHTKFCWNRTIGQWFMAKKAIFKMAAAAILNFKNFNFWWRDCKGAISDVMYKTSSKSDNFSLRYGDLTIFNMAAVRHLEFYTFVFLSRGPCQHAVLLSHTKFRWNRTIG